MGSKICSVKFYETKEQKKELDMLIDAHKNGKDELMIVLQKAQDIYGYLPYEVQKRIADGMDFSLEEVYGVVTFYSQFSLTPKGKYNVSVCLGTACYVKGAGEILDKVKEILKIGNGECTDDGLFSIRDTRCIGCCGLAPVMTVNEDVYGKISVADVDGIIQKYRNVK